MDQKASAGGRVVLSKWIVYLLAPSSGLPASITEVQWIDGVLRQVRAETHLRNDGALKVIVAVHTHRVGVRRPIVRDTRECRHFPFHEFLRILGYAGERFLHRRI